MNRVYRYKVWVIGSMAMAFVIIPMQCGPEISTAGGYNCLNLSNRLQVQLNTHLDSVPEVVHSISPNSQSQLISLPNSEENRRLYWHAVQTGKKTLLNESIYDLLAIKWSPNSQFAAYTYQPNPATYNWAWASIDGEQTKACITPPTEYSFSPNSDYFIFQCEGSLYITGNLSNTSPTEIRRLGDSMGYAWSPDGQRLAYVSESNLYMLALTTGDTYQENGIAGQKLAGWPSNLMIHWSPDGQHFAVEFEDLYTGKNGIYSVDESGFSLIDAFDVRPIDSVLKRRSRWSSDGRYFDYLLQPDPENFYELWHYDTYTNQHALIIDRVLVFDLHDDLYLVDHRQENARAFKVLSRTGELLGSYPLTGDSYWSCHWLNTPSGYLAECFGFYSFIFLDETANLVWPSDFDTLANINVEKYYTKDWRFYAQRLGQDGHFWLEFVDLATRQSYRLPDRFNDLFPYGVGSTIDFDLFPSPDDQIWFVRFNNLWFRLYPADEEWTLVDIGPSVKRIIWSPDGKRYVTLTQPDVFSKLSELVVRNRNNTKQWKLGLFPYYDLLTSSITWTQCGDILAPIRDHLAAESVN